MKAPTSPRHRVKSGMSQIRSIKTATLDSIKIDMSQTTEYSELFPYNPGNTLEYLSLGKI
jgi:hypothetical protein